MKTVSFDATLGKFQKVPEHFFFGDSSRFALAVRSGRAADVGNMPTSQLRQVWGLNPPPPFFGSPLFALKCATVVAPYRRRRANVLGLSCLSITVLQVSPVLAVVSVATVMAVAVIVMHTGNSHVELLPKLHPFIKNGERRVFYRLANKCWLTGLRRT